jgi:NAD(P)H dehydrogenase (quinone)
VKHVVFTSLANADDPAHPSVEKKDHIYTEEYHEAGSTSTAPSS